MKLTADQARAKEEILSSDAFYCMLFGGSRSGKTFLLVYCIVLRALKAPGSRHCILRFRFNHVKASIVLDTFPKVMEICFPDIKYRVDKQDWYALLPNGSEIWFGGLDDKERTEKILGKEYATVYPNECSQISFNSVGIVITRLAQKVNQSVLGLDGIPLKPRVYFDCNPPNKLHWTYRMFIKKVDPETGMPFSNPDNYASMQLNPEGNKENISDDYLSTLNALPARLKKRFLYGEFADATPNALFSDETIEKWRVIDGVTPQFVRVVIGIDPSGAGDVDNADNDEIGIVVAGLGLDGIAYVMIDATIKAGPATWGKLVCQLFDEYSADCVVAEVNFGGAMVQQTIQVARPRTPFYAVTASRGKAVRAEPISALYEDGKVRHVGFFHLLEEELAGFTTFGYVGSRSPNRADALVWAVNGLFPALTAPKKTETPVVHGIKNFFNRK